jgi:hypothetical protein
MTVLAAHPWATNADLIVDLHELGYIRDKDTVWDPTYGYGRWWTKYRPVNLVGTDIDPAKSGPLGSVDFTDAPPYWVRGVDVIAFDPPYKLNGTPSDPDEPYGVHERARWQDRMRLIYDGMFALNTALKPRGIMLLKCQDQVCSGKVRWQTIEFATYAEEVLELELVDMLHMIGGRPQPTGRRQVHARRNMSSLLVLKKGAL